MVVLSQPAMQSSGGSAISLWAQRKQVRRLSLAQSRAALDDMAEILNK
jgi:hypothetical protein